jgi:hypothetical protein
MSLRCSSLVTAAACFALPSVADAQASETTTPDQTSSHALEVGATLGIGSLPQSAYSPYSGTLRHGSYTGLELSVLYRATPRWSFGGLFAYAVNIDSLHLYRAAAAVSFHLVRKRFIDTWVGGEAGLAFARLGLEVNCMCADSSGSTPCYCDDYGNELHVRVAPEAGAAVGIDLLPIPWLSVGVVGRALGILFDRAPTRPDGTMDPAPDGPTLSFFGGVTGTARVPFF